MDCHFFIVPAPQRTFPVFLAVEGVPWVYLFLFPSMQPSNDVAILPFFPLRCQSQRVIIPIIVPFPPSLLNKPLFCSLLQKPMCCFFAPFPISRGGPLLLLSGGGGEGLDVCLPRHLCHGVRGPGLGHCRPRGAHCWARQSGGCLQRPTVLSLHFVVCHLGSYQERVGLQY